MLRGIEQTSFTVADRAWSLAFWREQQWHAEGVKSTA